MSRTISLAIALTMCITAQSLRAQDKFLGKSAEVWVRELKTSTDAKQRRNAAFALGKMGGRGYLHIVEMRAAYAREKDAKAKDTLLYAMGEICRESAAANASADLEKLFLGGLQERDPYLRRSAAFALGCLGSRTETTRKALDSALNDDSALVRQNAAWAIAQFGTAALPSLQRALRDGDSLVKRDAASALLQMDEADKVRELLKELLPLCRDANSEVRRAALNVLVRIVDPTDKEALPGLLEWHSGSSHHSRRGGLRITIQIIGSI